MPSKRKVIFIGGADFSGTTMLDLMLGTTEGVFSMGELHALYWPTSEHHLHPFCSCGSEHCEVWDWASLGKPHEIYQSLFKKYPHIRSLVDSSKNIVWIYRQSASLKKQDIETKHVLIWKQPDDYAKSCANRGRLNNWSKRWIRYHKAYFYKIPEPYIIHLNDLLKNFEQEMSALCDALNIKYQKSMFEYWNTKHHILFGSATAKLKLHEPGTPAWEMIKKSSHRRNILYSIPNEKKENFQETPIQIPKKHQEEIMRILSILRKNGSIQSKNYLNFSMLSYYKIWIKILLQRAYFLAHTSKL